MRREQHVLMQKYRFTRRLNDVQQYSHLALILEAK